MSFCYPSCAETENKSRNTNPVDLVIIAVTDDIILSCTTTVTVKTLRSSAQTSSAHTSAP